MQRFVFVLLLTVCAFLLGCDRGASQPSTNTTGAEDGKLSGNLTLTGSSTVAPLAAEIAKRFEKMHPNVRIDVQTGGSSRGISDARTGVADIGMASRELADDEKDLTSFEIAYDGISIIVHKDNPIEKITSKQVVDIFLGNITNWKAIGGPDAEITVAHKADGRATQKVFVEYFKLDKTAIKPDVIIGDNQQGIKTVIGDDNAIAYVSIGAADYEAKRGQPLKLVTLDGIEPSLENVASGKYPIARPLNLVTAKAPTGLAKAFIEFTRQKQNNDLVEALTFVAASP